MLSGPGALRALILLRDLLTNVPNVHQQLTVELLNKVMCCFTFNTYSVFPIPMLFIHLKESGVFSLKKIIIFTDTSAKRRKKVTEI